MPRYCAVKCCRNRGGTASRQENKRISFYPFPLQDKSRLQQWVDNIRREQWTPSRHQYLCSEHFTEDCFDIRWGIRYLKTSAIPTEGEKIITTIKRSLISKTSTYDTITEAGGSDVPPCKRAIILTRTFNTTKASTTTNNPAVENGAVIDGDQADLCSDTGTSCHPHPSEVQTDGGSAVDPGVALALPGSELQPHEQTDSAVASLCCESLDIYSHDKVNVDSAALGVASGQTFSFSPVEMIQEDPTGCILEEKEPDEGECVSVYEHSYCRPKTDKEQLWNKILSLHAKILDLDHREETTVAKIRALETEIALLKRDGAGFKEKQKVLEDYISSVLI
ncbi:THAP domain-containing protein 5-like isoform X2 [Genypterus blacodes]|uniref:THAP domain-containing protein 5-like isoform X2 n=1 Tax=Genypterus blacodes TaxID=154954 RepID=UPI003F76003A